jgi:iron complex transport system substrate-binding protein
MRLLLSLTRRPSGALPSLLVTAALLSACGSTSDDEPAGTGADSEAYSVTVTTPDDGEQTLTEEPLRIGVLNGNRVIPFLKPFLDEDHQLVGYGNDPDPAMFPWIQEELEAFTPIDTSDGPDVEAVAAWDADLVLGNGNIGDYWEPVRAVAPLVQLPETDWRATVTLLGEIFEEPAIAEEVIADTEALIDDARRDEPLTAAVLSPYQENGTIGTQVLGAELPNFLADLNILVADSPTAEGGYEDVSLEQLADRLADVDHVVVFNNGDELRDRVLATPVVANIPVIADGDVTLLTEVESGAAFPVNPLTVPVLLDAFSDLLAD